jgi:hypothetical protein
MLLTSCAGPGCGTTPTIDDPQLAIAPPAIGPREPTDDLVCGSSGAQQLRSWGPVEEIRVRLGRERPYLPVGPRNDRSNAGRLCGHRESSEPTGRVAMDDGERAVPPTTVHGALWRGPVRCRVCKLPVIGSTPPSRTSDPGSGKYRLALSAPWRRRTRTSRWSDAPRAERSFRPRTRPKWRTTRGIPSSTSNRRSEPRSGAPPVRAVLRPSAGPLLRRAELTNV